MKIFVFLLCLCDDIDMLLFFYYRKSAKSQLSMAEGMLASAKLQMKSAESQVTSSKKELDDAQDFLKGLVE